MHDAIIDETFAQVVLSWEVESVFCMQKEYNLRQRYACNFFDSPFTKSGV